MRRNDSTMQCSVNEMFVTGIPANRPLRRSPRKRGMVLVAVLVLFSISLVLFGLWSQAAIRERRTLSTEQFLSQAERLAEAGLERAIALRASTAQFTGEVWSVPAAQLDNTHAAQVRIRIAPTSNATGNRYEATAEFPAGSTYRAQITRSVEIPDSGPNKTP